MTDPRDEFEDLELDLGDLDIDLSAEDEELDLSILDAEEPDEAVLAKEAGIDLALDAAAESDTAEETADLLLASLTDDQDETETEDSDDDAVLEDPAVAKEPEETQEEQSPSQLADTEAAEKAIAQLHERLLSAPGEWYVVHTYSGMENRVKQNLDTRVSTLNMEDYIFETIVPTEQVDELRGNQRKTVTRTVLPGYVLVRMDLTDESWSMVRHTPSVTGFVGHAQVPVPISLEEVEKMLTPSVVAEATKEVKGPRRIKRKTEVVDFAVGDNVMVVDGPFDGLPATITELNMTNQRAKVLVELLGRETPMELTFAQIKKV